VALAWFKGKMAPLVDETANWAYQIGADELLWDYVDGGPGRVNQDKLHVIRAAAWIRGPKPSDARRDLLIGYAKTRPPTDWGHTYPLYMVGELDEGALLKELDSVTGYCSAGWALGMRKAAEGNLRDANLWFQVALETRADTLPPYAYAAAVLNHWVTADKFLDDIAEQKNALSAEF
jgi:hypothetical protein